MRLQVVITKPSSLDFAKRMFIAHAISKGFKDCQKITAYWQPTLFDQEPDAIVYGTVQRKYKCPQSPPEESRS